MNKFQEHIGTLYEDDEGGFMEVIGVITDPAIIMKNPISGKKEVHVIGCDNLKRKEKESGKEALNICIDSFRTKERINK